MPEPKLSQSTDVQLLGEIQAEIVGLPDHDVAVQPGEQVNLEREPEHTYDKNAIRVENRHFQPIGYLSNGAAAWSAPLIDAGKVRLDGYVPQANGGGKRKPHTSQLTLAVFLTGKDSACSNRPIPATARRRCTRWCSTSTGASMTTAHELVLEVAEGLRPLEEQKLLPETRLLLALLPGIARELQAAHGMQAVARLHSALAKFIIGEPVHHHNLTLFPLLWPDPQDPPYTLLQQAIEAGEAAVEEVSEAGSVPNLLLNNKGLRPVLDPRGRHPHGRQAEPDGQRHRAGGRATKCTVPVSCVEQGRWRYSRNSATASLTDGFAAAEDKLADYRRQLRLPAQAAGVLVANGDRVLGMDLFDSPKTFSAVWKRLSDAYFFDAVRNNQQRPRADRELASRFLAHVGHRAWPRVPGLGLGEELEVAGNGVVGAALLYGGAICHLAAFSEK